MEPNSTELTEKLKKILDDHFADKREKRKNYLEQEIVKAEAGAKKTSKRFYISSLLVVLIALVPFFWESPTLPIFLYPALGFGMLVWLFAIVMPAIFTPLRLYRLKKDLEYLNKSDAIDKSVE